MIDGLEELETLRLIRAFAKIRDPDKRKSVLEFTEAAARADQSKESESDRTAE